jgi:phage terminase large subunit GpA-like protein
MIEDESRNGAALMLRRPKVVRVSDAIAESLVTAGGPYDPSLTPYMREPADMLGSRQFHTVCVIGPARTGKTVTLIDGWIARNVVSDPGDMLVVQSSQDLARYYSKVRIKRMIEASPEVRQRQSPRRQDDNTYDKIFRSGMCLAFGWPSGAQLSGRDFRYVALTEYDAAADDIDGEGSLYVLARKRTETFLSAGKVLVESSVRREYLDPAWKRTAPHQAPPATGITAIYNTGTMCWLYWQCEHCGEWLALDPDVHVMFGLPPLAELCEELKELDGAKWAREHAHIACRKCGVEFDEGRKRELSAQALWVPSGCRIEDGGIVGDAPDSGIASYHIPCVAAAYQSWVAILTKYATAIQDFNRTADEVEIKSTVNLDQGRAYLPMRVGRRSDVGAVESRRSDLRQGTVPRGVRFLTAQVDVQAGTRRGFVVQVVGWGAHREHWIVDRYALKSSARIGEDGHPLPIDPAAYVEDWGRLTEKCIDRRYPLDDGTGRTMGIRLTVCDSGGEDGVTKRGYDYWRQLNREGKGGKFRLVKGRDSGPSMIEAFPESRGKAGATGDVPVLMLNTDALKDVLANDLARTAPGPGYWHIPAWMDAGNVRELTAEVRTNKGWRKATAKAKNESVDLCVYGEGAYARLQGDRIDWRSPPSWAAEWDSNSEVSAAGADAPKQIARRPLRASRSSYMQG